MISNLKRVHKEAHFCYQSTPKSPPITRPALPRPIGSTWWNYHDRVLARRGPHGQPAGDVEPDKVKMPLKVFRTLYKIKARGHGKPETLKR